MMTTKKIILLFAVVVLFAFESQAQVKNDSIKNYTVNTDSVIGTKAYLKGKIINEVSLTPDCGTIAFGTVIEFEIIFFSDMMYPQKNVGIIFTCPEFYKENFFEVGKTYEVNLADKNQATFGWSIPNEKLLEKYNLKSKLWAISAKKLD